MTSKTVKWEKYSNNKRKGQYAADFQVVRDLKLVFVKLIMVYNIK